MITWAQVDAALRQGLTPGVPAGVDFDEFLWQTRPAARDAIELRNPGRVFTPARWAQALRRKGGRP